MKTPTSITADYRSFLIEVKGRIQSARLQAGRAVNRELVMLYWYISATACRRNSMGPPFAQFFCRKNL
jgi:hypothetical protein